MKIVFVLALTAFALLTAPYANSDVISPTNDDTAFRFTLARPEADYIPFKLFYGSIEVKPNTPVHVDITSKCLSLGVSLNGPDIHWTNYCTDFKKGTITDIKIYGLKLNGRAATADGIYGDIPILLEVRNRWGTLHTIPSTLTNFEKTKLVPFFTDLVWEASIRLFSAQTKLKIDSATGIAEYTLPVETLAPITIKRVQSKSFPDFQPAQLLIERRPKWSGALPRTERTFAVPNQNDTSIPVLLMPWPQSDEMRISFISMPNKSPVVLPDFTYGNGTRVLPPDRVPPTYPTELNIYRIDVDDVAVTSIDGTMKSAKGTYTVFRLTTSTAGPLLVAGDVPTQMGIDVIAGRYQVIIKYIDPFTLTTELKMHELYFK